MPLDLKGSGGALLHGRRVVTELDRWQARSREEGGLLVVVDRHRPDPYEWEHHGPDLRAELEIGRAIWRGTAEILSTEPLQFVLETDDS